MGRWEGGGTPGEWAQAVHISDPPANPMGQQGFPVLVQWIRAKRQCRWSPRRDRTLAWCRRRFHPVPRVGPV